MVGALLVLLRFQSLHDLFISRLVRLLEMLQMRAAIGHHLQEPAAGMVVFLVLFEVQGEFVDLSRKDGNLDFRRAGVLVVRLAFLDNPLLFLSL